MGTHRRNAFTLGRPGEHATAEPPQLPVYSEQDFNIVTLNEEDSYSSHNEDDSETRTSSCHLTEEQITGKYAL